MIQIRVSVPVLTEKQAEAFLALKRLSQNELKLPEASEQISWQQRGITVIKGWLHGSQRSAERYAKGIKTFLRGTMKAAPIFGVIAVFAIAGWKIGLWLPLPRDGRTSEKASQSKTNYVATNYHLFGLQWSLSNLEFRVESHPLAPAASPALEFRTNAADGAPSFTDPARTNQRPSTEGRQNWVVLPPEPASRGFGVPSIVIGLGLLFACGLAVLAEPKITIKDSDAFKAALQEWEKVISTYHPTPRSLKRLINRLLNFVAVG